MLFALMLQITSAYNALWTYDVINYNDVTSTTCSHEYARKVPFTDIQTIKSFSLIYWGSKLFDYLSYLHEIVIHSNAFISGQHSAQIKAIVY